MLVPWQRETLWALHYLPPRKVQGNAGDAAVGTAPRSHPSLGTWAVGTGKGWWGEMETWEKKQPSSILGMGEMQTAPGLRVTQQHPGMEGAVVRWVGDARCRQPGCQAQPSLAAWRPPPGSSPPRPCISPAHPSASVSPLEQGRVQAFWAWWEKGELSKPDEPREDLATGAGSILPVLQTRAGCEVHPHVCQGTPGIRCQQPGPARPPLLPAMRKTAAAPLPSPRSKGGRRGQDGASCHPDPSTAEHPRLPEPFWRRWKRHGHHTDPWLWEMRPQYPGRWHGEQRSLPAPPCCTSTRTLDAGTWPGG